jgi:2-polyprenyl-6-methoxyphenol hydroxylase-like FAD-dependent oxidoreductase
LTVAAAFGSAGFSVICTDPDAPVTDRDATGADHRSTAFLHPSIPVLQAAGLWDRLAPHAAPLQIMRIVDAGGPIAEPRIIKDFDAAEISDQPFGWNLPNWLLRREMVARLGELHNVAFLPGTATAGVMTREAEALATLSDGQRISARLIVAADGRNSTVRQEVGIEVSTTRYGQKALAFAVAHPVPHDNISTEIHRSGGPFTLVPLPDRNGGPASSVVWMESGPEVARLAALPQDAFEAAGRLPRVGHPVAVRVRAQVGALRDVHHLRRAVDPQFNPPLREERRRAHHPVEHERLDCDRLAGPGDGVGAAAGQGVAGVGGKGRDIARGHMQTGRAGLQGTQHDAVAEIGRAHV